MTSTLSDDANLVAGLHRGTPAAAEALVDRFAGSLIRYFAAHLPDPQAAEDMTQEVFLRLIRVCRRPKPPEIQSLYSFVFTIARHLAMDVCKAQGRHPQMESLDAAWFEDATGPVMLEIASPVPNPRETVAGEEQRDLVHEALRQIPAEYREVVVLHHIQGLSGKEIASVVGIAEGTVWSRLGRGVQELKRLLGDQVPTTPQAVRRSGDQP